jgi:hypothetical protein
MEDDIRPVVLSRLSARALYCVILRKEAFCHMASQCVLAAGQDCTPSVSLQREV